MPGVMDKRLLLKSDQPLVPAVPLFYLQSDSLDMRQGHYPIPATRRLLVE